MTTMPTRMNLCQIASGGPVHGIPQEIHTNGLSALLDKSVAGRTLLRPVAQLKAWTMSHWAGGAFSVVGKGDQPWGVQDMLDQRPPAYVASLKAATKEIRTNGGKHLCYLGSMGAYESPTDAALAMLRYIDDPDICDGICLDGITHPRLRRPEFFRALVYVLQRARDAGKVTMIEPRPTRDQWKILDGLIDGTFTEYVSGVARLAKAPQIADGQMRYDEMPKVMHYIWVNLPPNGVVDDVAGQVTFDSAFGTSDMNAIASKINGGGLVADANDVTGIKAAKGVITSTSMNPSQVAAFFKGAA